MEEHEITIAILAGGASRRMGRDKALLPVEGEPLLLRIARAAQGTGAPVTVVGRDRPDEWPEPDVRFVGDDVKGIGPLGGLATALRSSGTGVILLACDMPMLTTGAIAWLIDHVDDASRGVVVRNGDRLEPLFAFYPLILLDEIGAMIRDGRHRLRDLVSSFTIIDAPDALRPALANINTPDDLARLSPLRAR